MPAPSQAVSVDPAVFRALAIRHGLKLLAVGIKPNRMWTLSSTLKAAAQITGKTYPRTRAACLIAADDIKGILDAN